MQGVKHRHPDSSKGLDNFRELSWLRRYPGVPGRSSVTHRDAAGSSAATALMINLLVPSWVLRPWNVTVTEIKGKALIHVIPLNQGESSHTCFSLSQLQWETVGKWDFGIWEFRCQTLVGMTSTVLSFVFTFTSEFLHFAPYGVFLPVPAYSLSPSPLHVIAAFQILLIFPQYI